MKAIRVSGVNLLLSVCSDSPFPRMSLAQQLKSVKQSATRSGRARLRSIAAHLYHQQTTSVVFVSWVADGRMCCRPAPVSLPTLHFSFDALLC